MKECRSIQELCTALNAVRITAYGTGWGSHEDNAINICNQYGGTSCRVIFTRHAVFYSL
jgi:hypothetical protein